MSAARPASVTALETIAILRIAGAVVVGGGIEVGFGLLFDVLWLAFSFWLVLKVTRRGSRKARIAQTALFAFGIVVLLVAVAYFGPAWRDVVAGEMDGPALALSILMWALAVARLVLLWTPSTTRWIEQHQAIRRSA